MMNGKREGYPASGRKRGKQGSGAGAVSQEGLDDLHGLALLFFGRDSGGQISLAGAVVAELGMVAAFDLHNVSV